LLDYPGQVACTVFTCGCNFRCPFCHNPALVVGRDDSLTHSFADVLAFLESRHRQLDAICLTGGEPLLHEESLLLMQAAKAMGYRVKLDTNGSKPDLLRQAVADGSVDYVAMDIKNSPEKYAVTSGVDMLDAVRASVAFLQEGHVRCEFRTTVTGCLHEAADFAAIGQWLAGAERYFLQGFKDSGDILGGDPAPFAVSDEQLEEFLAVVRAFIPSAEIRGR